MQRYVALGAATVEADCPDEVVERVRYEDQSWTVRHIVTASEWVQLEGTGRRPWIGRTAFLTIPMITYGAITGQSSVAALAGTVAGLSPFF